MKEIVLSAKTSGTARKRFEVIVEVIKKNPPPIFFKFFFYTMLFLLSPNLFGFRERVTYFASSIHTPAHPPNTCCHPLSHVRHLRDTLRLLLIVATNLAILAISI